MFGVAGFNIYIGLYDTTLGQLNTLHHNLDWVLAAIAIAAAILLLVKPGSRVMTLLAGAIWPVSYVISLFIDVETRLCLGTNFNCWPSVAGAYSYLILGSSVEGWVLWPLTIPVVIVLLLAVVVLSLISLGSR